MKRNILLIIATILTVNGSIYAKKENKGYISKYYPLNMARKSSMFSSPDQIRDRFEINIDAMGVKKVRNRKQRYSAIMDDTFDAEILSTPLIKQLKTMDVIYAHPNFISVIKFPPSIKINKAKTNIKMQDFEYSENLLTFSPAASSKMGNIVITAYDSSLNRNKVFNFIIKRYSNDNIKIDNEYGLYATNKGEFLSLTIFYRQLAKINKIKILQKYVELNGIDYFKKRFSKNGEYETLLLDGVPVYIVRDDKNGNISYFDIDFRVTIGGV